MDKKYVLAIDQSTQGTKAIIFDKEAELICRCDMPHRQIVNNKGWVSHDLNEIYENTINVVKNVVEKSGIRKDEIACIGISNQRETSAAWKKSTGEPLSLAIVWQCARASEICNRIKADVNSRNISEFIQKRTGMPLSPYFPAAKFAWFLENVEAVKEAAKINDLCFGTIDTWLLYKLTNREVYATDYSNASRTQLFNIQQLKWDAEICSMFGIKASMLPLVQDSSHNYGETDLGGYLDNKIPVCGIIGDSQGALFGQGCVEKGMVKATYGTGSSVMMNVGRFPVFSNNGLVTSLAWGINGKIDYVLEGNINYSGAVITWMKDDMELIKHPGETQEMAFQANQSDTTYLIPAFTGLGAPYWKPEAKALIYGMGRTTGKNEIVKAALESIAYQITDIVEMMKSEDGIIVKEFCVDGGPTANQYLMKFQSDMLETTVKLPRCEESSALGATLMAGLCYGIYNMGDVILNTDRKNYIPSMSKDERTKRYDGWKKIIEGMTA